MLDRSLFKPLLAVACVTALLLLVPLLAMRVSAEVTWGLEDFAAAALVLFSTGAGMVLVVRHVRRRAHRVALIGALALALALVWAELAVGLFD